MASDQKILTKGQITAGWNFHVGQRDVTPTSREYCSRLQQSRCHAVIEDWIIPFAACVTDDWITSFAAIHCSRFPMLFDGPNNPQNCPFPWGILTRSNTWLLGPTSQPQMTSWSVKPFLHSTTVWPIHRQTDTQTMLRVVVVVERTD